MTYNKDNYRSKGERRIAKFLEESEIDFKYEYPIAIKDNGLVKIWYPDFTLPDYSMIIEYFGVSGDTSYDRQLAHKIKTFKQAGVDGIYVVESSFSGDWQEQVLDKIKQSLEDKVDKLNTLRLNRYSTKTS